MDLDLLDYKKLGLKVGLEIHQQLDTKGKLFCSCPTNLAPENIPRKTVQRYLRVTKSEIGEIDPAALYEMKKGRKIIYEVPEGHTCLVELDEEPPHELNREALKIAMAIAMAFNSRIVDEIYVMRKIVIDGSNTTGFQRTAIVALGGKVKDEDGDVRIQTICLEEDAARKVSEGKGFVKYNLDRLGVPLVEISTAPDITSPEQATRVALRIGLLMRLTGKVKRGIGTIRQDLNISIRGGEKIEVKGVSKLELISKVIKYEAQRQLNLLKIKRELERRGVNEEDIGEEVVEITHILSESRSKLIKNALDKGKKAYALTLRRFKDILGWNIQPGRRFGTELSDYAKAWAGVQGIIHSDELPGYGIDSAIVRRLYQYLGLKPSEDAFLFVLADEDRAKRALRAIKDRVKEALKGVPKETRGANPDGTTRYLRPQPGAARMYPETDIPPVRISSELTKEAAKIKPPTPEEMLTKLTKEHGLSKQLAEQLLRDPQLITYLDLVNEIPQVPPQLIASTLMIHVKALRSEGYNTGLIDKEVLKRLFEEVAKGLVAKEAIPTILEEYIKSEGTLPITEVIKNFKPLSKDEIIDMIDGVISAYKDYISQRGMRAFSLIMGKVMSKARGKADGSLIAQIVRKRISEVMRENK